MLRIALFLITNLAVMLLLSMVCHVFGIDQWAASRGYGGMGNLLVFAAVIGLGGSFISLLMSKTMAKASVGAKIIDQPRNEGERWLLETVRRHAAQAGIGMPQVALYDSPEMNAFATGASRNNALVAVSTGLLGSMDRQQVSAVLGHEIGHVANGDMVTLTLIQGVVNTFVIFLARIVGRFVDSWLAGNRDSDAREGGGFGYFIIVMALELVFGLFASVIVATFSRWREFRADAAGARLAGKSAMISALNRLKGDPNESELPKTIAAFGIAGPMARGIQQLLMSHPPLDKRIARLQQAD